MSIEDSFIYNYKSAEEKHEKEKRRLSNVINTERIFESGSKRDNDSDKPLTANLTAYTRLRYGYHMRKNANRYGKGNWELGQPDVVLLESIDRHLCQHMIGDRSEDHLSAMIFGIVMLMQNEQRNGIDVDKYYKKVK